MRLLILFVIIFVIIYSWVINIKLPFEDVNDKIVFKCFI